MTQNERHTSEFKQLMELMEALSGVDHSSKKDITGGVIQRYRDRLGDSQARFILRGNNLLQASGAMIHSMQRRPSLDVIMLAPIFKETVASALVGWAMAVAGDKTQALALYRELLNFNLECTKEMVDAGQLPPNAYEVELKHHAKNNAALDRQFAKPDWAEEKPADTPNA